MFGRAKQRRLARELKYLRDDVERLRRDLWRQTYGNLDGFTPGRDAMVRPYSQADYPAIDVSRG